MSVTLQQAENILAQLVAALEAFDGSLEITYQDGNVRRVLRLVSIKEIRGEIEYWSRHVNTLKRRAAGGPKLDHALADFR